MRDSRSSLTAITTAEVALYILNSKRSFVTEMEHRYGVSIAVQASDRMHGANFRHREVGRPGGSAKAGGALDGGQHGLGLRR